MRSRLWFLARNLFRTGRADRELDAELESAVDLLAAEHEARGLSPDAARRAAKLEMGGTAQVVDEVRSIRLGHGFSTVWSDLRYGWRGLRHSPGFSVVAISTLALGLGASIATFSIVHSVLWRELPYPGAERLIAIEADLHGKPNLGPASGEVKQMAVRSRFLTSLGTVNGVDASLDIGGELAHVPAAYASDNVLRLLGADPVALGRAPTARQDAGPTVVRAVAISHRLWRDRLGSDPNVIGRHISANNIDVEIVGVLREGLQVHLPPSSHLAEDVDVWFPAVLDDSRSDHASPALAMLLPGATVLQAQRELDVFATEFVRDTPRAYPNGILRYRARPPRDAITAEVRPALLALTFAVAFVLLISWINTANLQIARAQARGRELSVRRALGASRARVVRQLVTECAVLATISAALGFALAHAGVRAFSALMPHQLPRQATISLDQTVVFVAIGLTILTTLALGALPALPTGRSDWTPLRSGRGEAGAPRRALQRGLLIAEVALTVVSLAAAGLMLRTFVKLTHAPVGFDPANIIVANVPMSGRMFPQPARRYAIYQDAIERVRALPGVTAASGAGPLPFTFMSSMPRYFRDGAATDSGTAVLQVVLPDYFRIMGIRLIAGRDFTDADAAARRLVVVVDERIANQLWQGQAIGRKLRLRSTAASPLEVVGVTNAVRMTRVRDDVMPGVFVPHHVHPIPMSLVVKTTQGMVVASSIRTTVESLGTGRAVHGVQPMADIAARSIDDERLAASVLGVFAATTLVLAAIGLYGTLTYLISRRQREFGVRLAMGATRMDLMRLVTTEGLILVAIGTMLGLAGSAGAGRILRDLLYGVSPADLTTSALVVAVVAVTSAIAVSYPAWRAGRIDPNIALRSE